MKLSMTLNLSSTFLFGFAFSMEIHGLKAVGPVILVSPAWLHGQSPRPWKRSILLPFTSKVTSMYVRAALRHFTHYFEGLKDTVASLYVALVQSYSGGPDLRHAKMKNILLNGFLPSRSPTYKILIDSRWG